MKKLLVLSGKGGTGKTTVASAIIEFSSAKAFADCDVDAPNLHILNSVDTMPQKSDFLGGEKAVINPGKCTGCGLCQKNCRFDAIEIKDGKAKVNEFACEGCAVCFLVCKNGAVTMNEDVAGRLLLYDSDRKFATATLKMGRGNSGKLVSEVKSVLYKAAENVEFAVLDGSPGIGCPVMASIAGVDFVLVVTEPTLSGMSDLERICGALEICRVKGGVCVNKCDLNPKLSLKTEKWCKENGWPFLGNIPYDGNIPKAINEGKKITDYGFPALKAIREVYGKVMTIMFPGDKI